MFTSEGFELLRKFGGRKYEKKKNEDVEAAKKLGLFYKNTEEWGKKLQAKKFPGGSINIRKSGIDQSQKFSTYQWAKIYPHKKSPVEVAYTVSIDAPEGFVVKIDTVNQKGKVRKAYENLQNDHFIKKTLNESDGLKLSIEELVDWSIDAINEFDLTYEKVLDELKIQTSIQENNKNLLEDNVQPPYPLKILSHPLNQILYGPPGTGKTFNTVTEALAIFDEFGFIDNQEEQYDKTYAGYKKKFDALKVKGHIEFVTFHQSFSYEDFVEGIRAETNKEGDISYSIKDGLFKKIAIEALYSKLELPDTSDYDYKKSIIAVRRLSDFEKSKGKPYVLIIDEINRGNTSRIFGELITLIEDTKRTGSDEAMDAVLPYSQEKFTVPDNLYIIGTMNTADRSLALIDTALRRRFDFIEKIPEPALIVDKNKKAIMIGGEIDIQKMLETINNRIEALYDREHTIGHAFFMKLKDDPSISNLAYIFKNKILPLLEEYFFEDWKKICQVLGKSGIYKVKDFKELGLSTGNNYSRDEKLLAIPETYINIYKDTDSTQRDSTGSS